MRYIAQMDESYSQTSQAASLLTSAKVDPSRMDSWTGDKPPIGPWPLRGCREPAPPEPGGGGGAPQVRRDDAAEGSSDTALDAVLPREDIGVASGLSFAEGRTTRPPLTPDADPPEERGKDAALPLGLTADLTACWKRWGASATRSAGGCAFVMSCLSSRCSTGRRTVAVSLKSADDGKQGEASCGRGTGRLVPSLVNPADPQQRRDAVGTQ